MKSAVDTFVQNVIKTICLVLSYPLAPLLTIYQLLIKQGESGVESRLMAIASEYGKLYFNPQLKPDDELAHAVYRVLVDFGGKERISDDVEVDEIVSEDDATSGD